MKYTLDWGSEILLALKSIGQHSPADFEMICGYIRGFSDAIAAGAKSKKERPTMDAAAPDGKVRRLAVPA